MKKIFEIFWDDVKRIAKSKMAIVLVLGITIIPGIYAWLNIDSNWGPYDNTGNIPIAVVNNDTGAVVLGEEVSLGGQIEDSLRKNDALKWTFTNTEDAMLGVEQSRYYGAIVIPDDFSKSITTILGEDGLKKPKFDFYVNNKKNPIAPIIINKAVGTIRDSVNQAFIKTIVYKTVGAAEKLNLSDKSVTTVDNLVAKLEDTKGRVGQLRAILRNTDLATETAGKSIGAIRQLLPAISDVTKATKQDLNDLRSVAQTMNDGYAKIEQKVATMLDETEASIKDILAALDKVSNGNVIQNISTIPKKIDELLARLEELDETLAIIAETTQIPGIEELRGKVQDLAKKVEEAKTTINTTLSIISDVENAKAKVRSIGDNLNELRAHYQNGVKSDLNNLYKNAAKTVGNAADTILNLNTSFNNVDASLKYIMQALESGGELAENTDVILATFQSDIDNIIAAVEKVRGSELYNNLLNLLKNKPDEVADFFSNLVEANEKQVYPVDSYGAEMAPFYSILACWVGCTILAAVLKVDIKKTKVTAGAKNYQLFFGRFMLFASLAMLQGLVIGIGDLMMQVQTVSWPLFLVTLMISSAVFALIIYALVIVFGKVGQALAIVLLVLQVAGSGGTFPIELLPPAFQLLQPYMPFYPAMNATRETIGGFYQNDYLMYILLLLCHTIIPLVLGLVLSKHTAKIRGRLSKELEDTGVVG